MLSIILIVFACCFVVERWMPGWNLPEVPTWTIRALAINFVQLLVVVVAGYTWEKWLSTFSIFHLSDVTHPLGGGFITYIISTLCFLLVAPLAAYR